MNLARFAQTPAAADRRARWRSSLLIVWLAAASGSAAAGELVGRVVDVIDGDSITVIDADRRLHEVRLAGIDALERGQPGGHRSKESLANAVYGREVRVNWNARGARGEIIGIVWVAAPDSPCREPPACPKTLDAGLMQLTLGRAWLQRDSLYALDDETLARYAFAEQEAKAKKAGLWRSGTAVAPWEWRRRHRSPGTD